MKYLIFLRHGKAEQYSFDKDDFERNLSSRGVNNCELIAEILGRSKIIPEKIITSPANRTQQTAETFSRILNLKEDIIFPVDRLYDYVGVSDIQSLLAEEADELSTIMIVGHNPWISAVVSHFSKEFYRDLPTTGLVVLAFQVDKWKAVEANMGMLEFFEYPKKYV